MEKRSHGHGKEIKGNMLFLAVIAVGLCVGVLGGRTSFEEDFDLKRHLKLLNKPAIKTIKSEDGDIIDCVDIYKQPAFDNPLLQNHTLQMRPSNLPKASERLLSSMPLQQLWQKSGSCPKGTVPIRRTRKSDLLRVVSFESYGKKNTTQSLNSNSMHENAVVVTTGELYGAKARINVWNNNVEPNEFSASKIVLLSDATPDANSIQAGWLVNLQLFGDTKTRLFTYWTGDGFKKTGCFNMLCPGFVQVSQEISLGVVLSASTYGGDQQSIELLVFKDPAYKLWWLLYDGKPIGYWPISLFNNLETASFVEWGGEVLNSATAGHHTTTQMGSGHFPNEGYGKSSFFQNILVVDSSNTYIAPDSTAVLKEKPGCYDLNYEEGRRWGDDQGYYFYYGGPGFGPNCN